MKQTKAQTDKIIMDEENLRQLINHTHDPIWYVDADYKIVECNHSFKKWVAHFIGKELGKGDNVLYGGQDKIYQYKFESCYMLALTGSQFNCVEDMTVDNERRYTSVSFNPVFDKGEKIIGVSCFARDITEQRMHLIKIEEQNKILMEIAAIQSHKVRGPVATILGLGQFFNNDDLGDPVNKILMEGIQSVSAELDKIIKEVVSKSNKAGIHTTH